MGDFPASSLNRIALLLSSAPTCDQHVINYTTMNENNFVFFVRDFTYLEYYVCSRWTSLATPRMIQGTSVLVKEISAVEMSVGIVGHKDKVVINGIGLNSGDKVMFAKDFCTHPTHNGPFTVKNLRGELYIEAEWTMASERPLNLVLPVPGKQQVRDAEQLREVRHPDGDDVADGGAQGRGGDGGDSDVAGASAVSAASGSELR